MNNENSSKIIKECLNLKTSPVAVKLFKDKSDAEKILNKTEKTLHCQAILDASKGKSFYGDVDSLGCPIGREILGLKELDENLVNGLKFDKMNVTKTQEAGKNLIDNVAKLENIEAIGYSPLEKSNFTPDVIAIVGKSRQIFNIARAHTYENGDRLNSSISGTQSFCSDIVVKSYLTNSLNISYGCIGSHLSTDLGDNQTVIGIPYTKLNQITTALEITKIDKLSG